MRRKIIAFDLDGTLAESKSPLPDEMSEILDELLGYFQVCVISGGKFEQFQKQLLANLKADPIKLEALHLMPTCGTRYYRYDVVKADWQMVYAEDFTEEEKKQIVAALGEGLDALKYREAKPWGELIEDRGSQVTLSALGQEAPVDAKEEWDPDNSKKLKLRNYVAQRIPQFEVRAGGSTSIDVTKLGIDKAYGMHKLMDILEVSKEQILFFGDRLAEGGNDYPVKAMGIDSLEVSHWQHTAIALRAVLATIERN
ncbi:HAD-IIB family hydrolase [Candidatus Saccharibacteria bacterium]|nr:MAG: HAD-IIB family hydrolase [Candidatus Saccharibacteria bacterium]